MNFKNCGLILLVCVSGSLSAANALFLENQSGDTIAYQVNDRKEKLMNHGVRHLLGTINPQENVPKAFARTLNIKSAGFLSSISYYAWYTPLNDYLKDIRADRLTACQLRWPRCNQNAVIRIKPGGMYSGWQVAVTWENSRKIETFEMSDFK